MSYSPSPTLQNPVPEAWLWFSSMSWGKGNHPLFSGIDVSLCTHVHHRNQKRKGREDGKGGREKRKGKNGVGGKKGRGEALREKGERRERGRRRKKGRGARPPRAFTERLPFTRRVKRETAAELVRRVLIATILLALSGPLLNRAGHGRKLAI